MLKSFVSFQAIPDDQSKPLSDTSTEIRNDVSAKSELYEDVGKLPGGGENTEPLFYLVFTFIFKMSWMIHHSR